METKMKIVFGYLLLPVLMLNSRGADFQTWSQWSWYCVNETCIKNSIPYDRNGTSLNLCKLFCGKYGSLWPMPTGPTTLDSKIFFFHPASIYFDYVLLENGPDAKEYLKKVSEIFRNKLLASCRPQECTPVSDSEILINFKVSKTDLKLNWDTDESYALDITKRGSHQNVTIVDIKIKAKTVYGARHALETIGQLTATHTFSTSANEKKVVLAMISSAQIIDSPTYPHRGLVVDTARHFISVPAILRTLDAMAMTKMNVFHWHATDTQSFPLETPTVPEMYSYGAYSLDQIYSVQDIQNVVEYAKLRGIRVIMEIDGPAHAGNGWQWGESANLGKLALCVNEQPWRKLCIQPPCGQLNPVNPNVLRVLKNIFVDLFKLLTPGEAMHMGGDEVFFPCWNSSAEVVNWMIDHNFNLNEEGFLNLWGVYQENVLHAFDEVNPTAHVPIILWSSSLTNPQVIERYLDKNRYIIETWLEASNPIPKQLLDKNYKLIMCTKDKWYLDHGFWGTTMYHSWKVAYDNKLPLHPNVLGGEGAMWSERVDDFSLDVKVWPRTAAIGERLWTNPKTGSNKAETRFENFRERLIANGIGSDATSPYYCYQNEEQCA